MLRILDAGRPSSLLQWTKTLFIRSSCQHRKCCENVCTKDWRVRGRSLWIKKGGGATTSTNGHCVHSGASNCPTQSSSGLFTHGKTMPTWTFFHTERLSSLATKGIHSVVIFRNYVSEYLPPEWQHLMYRHIKEEEEGEGVLCIKEEEEEFLHMKEEEQEEVIQVPSTDVHLKSEEDGQSEERLGAETPESESAFLAKCVKTDKEFFSGSRCYPGTTFKTTSNSSSDGDHCGGSQIDDDNDDHEQSEGDQESTGAPVWGLRILYVQRIFEARIIL
ncbi:uncharacterized protein LOC133493625 isoform X6 [Syngnathoides biaculeatus]|uniref:uncharacterized protein LOC133493625 isoform X6 n=1 Tax=Syngnathoides biaculeatus TaxID=300417 RepID=UPI002ADDE2CC|nr:uncharacterized protein LOC133493625 isoform X6 [Syngnathoides biaculeatus]